MFLPPQVGGPKQNKAKYINYTLIGMSQSVNPWAAWNEHPLQPNIATRSCDGKTAVISSRRVQARGRWDTCIHQRERKIRSKNSLTCFSLWNSCCCAASLFVHSSLSLSYSLLRSSIFSSRALTSAEPPLDIAVPAALRASVMLPLASLRSLGSTN